MKLHFITPGLVFISIIAACKKHSTTPTIPPVTKNTATVIQITPPSTYPYCDTFYGSYQENVDHMYYISGHSKVFVWHLNKDSIDIKADSIGEGRPSHYINHDDTIVQTTKIDIPARINADTLSFSLSVQWAKDRSDFYMFSLYRDSLCVKIYQPAGGCEDGDYTGSYKGYPKKSER